MGRHAEAVPHLRYSFGVFHRTPVDPRFKGGSAIQLAKALWDEGRDRAESRRIATQALADYRADPTRFAKEIAAVEAWLAEHR